MAEAGRIVACNVRRIDDGASGYRIENAFGQSIQVLPTPPSFRMTIALEWKGAMPEDVAALIARARAAGFANDALP